MQSFVNPNFLFSDLSNYEYTLSKGWSDLILVKLAVKLVKTKKLAGQLNFVIIVVIVKDMDLIPMDIEPRVGSRFDSLMVKCLSPILKRSVDLSYAYYQLVG